MKKFKFALLPLLLLASLVACRKNHLIESTEIITPNPEIIIETEVEGIVTDDDGAVAAAIVTSAGDTATTDAAGKFKLKGFWGSRAVVRVEKKGYFPSFRDFVPEWKKVAQVEVFLAKKKTAHLLSPTNLFVAEKQDSILYFGKFSDQNGNERSEALLFFRRIDPSFDDKTLPLPFLQADSLTLPPLESFGTLQILLEDSDGNPLFPKNPLLIFIQIPPDKVATAPSSTPLYFFSENYGAWLGANSAGHTGESFRGEVDFTGIWTAAR